MCRSAADGDGNDFSSVVEPPADLLELTLDCGVDTPRRAHATTAPGALPTAPASRPTVVDVAALAGVSLATVSRAFNTPDRVESGTLARVRAAAAKLAYQPYGLARSLRRRRSMVVGVLIPSLSNTYFAGTVDLLQALLARQGYTTLLACSNYDPDTERDALRAMVAQGVDAVVAVGRAVGAAGPQVLEGAGVPHLRCWSSAPDEPSIGFDHGAAMAGVASHLLAQGHRRFARVAPFQRLRDATRERLTAVREALAEAGVALPAAAVVDDGGLGIASGRVAWRVLRERGIPATAVLCSNDNLAAGVILECQDSGLQVPRDLSVSGYNDLEIAAAFRPPITTVRTPVDRHAASVAEALLAMLQHGAPAPQLRLQTELVLRASTGPAPAGGQGQG